MTVSSNKHKRHTVTNYKQHKSIVTHDSTTGSHPSNHPQPPIAHSTSTQQQHRRTTLFGSSATVTSEEQQTHEAQQAASKTAIPTQSKSRHYTHIITISSNKHKRRTVTNYKGHKSIVPHDSTKPPKNPRTTNACTYHPGTHTPCTHAHTNNNPSNQAHPHTHNNDTNSCKLFELCAKFVRSSYELRTKFVTTTFTVPICEALWGRISYEFRTNFVRTSYEFRTIFAGHWQKSHTNTTYACTEVPTPSHISLYLPPRHTHTWDAAF